MYTQSGGAFIVQRLKNLYFKRLDYNTNKIFKIILETTDFFSIIAVFNRLNFAFNTSIRGRIICRKIFTHMCHIP